MQYLEIADILNGARSGRGDELGTAVYSGPAVRDQSLPAPSALSCCAARFCPPQFVLLLLKLEDMENVESVSLPPGAHYVMTVRRGAPHAACEPLSRSCTTRMLSFRMRR